MSVEIAKVCGLCGGCKFAITNAQKEIANHKNVVLFKEIVHNKNVNTMLKNCGVKIEDNIQNLHNADIVIIRAHGEPPETFEYLNKNNIKYKDCTCVNVRYIHKLVMENSERGYNIIVIGKYGKKTGVVHPEVYGILGYIKSKAILIEDEQDLDKLQIETNKAYLVCQTTFNSNKADCLISKITQIYKDKNIELISNKSVCPAQKNINKSSLELAQNCDLMIVVGGTNSSNTKELFNNVGVVTKTVFIEDVMWWQKILKEQGVEIDKNTKIGLTAGASTQIEELVILKENIENYLNSL